MISSIPDASTSIAATVLPSPVRRIETAFEIHHLASDAAGVLVDANNPEGDTVVMRDTQERARAIGWQIVVAKVAAERDFDLAFATLVQQRASALLVTGGPFFNGRRRRIAVLAIRHAIPAIYAVREYVEAGGLMSYGSQTDAYRGAGAYVGRILKGAKPAELPVLLPTKFELVINLATAKALGLEVPPSLLLSFPKIPSVRIRAMRGN
jgi:putative ABC transport system substrate-binding protein